MDVSYDEQKVDYIIADLNRMKQGNEPDWIIRLWLTITSAGQPNHERCEVHFSEAGREENHSLYGCFYGTTDFLPTERYIFRTRQGDIPHRLDQIRRFW